MPTSPLVLPHNVSMLHSSARHYLGKGSVTAADHAAPLGHSPSPLGSSGADQLQAQGVGPLSSTLSPTSLLFSFLLLPLPPSLLSCLLLFLLLLRGHLFLLILLLSPVFLLLFRPLPQLPFLLSLLLPCPRLPSLPLPSCPLPLPIPRPRSSLPLLLPLYRMFRILLLPLSFRRLFLPLPPRSPLTSLSLLLLVSLLPLSLPRLLLPPLCLLFPFLLFRCMLPLPPFSRLQLLLLAVLPCHLPFLLLLPLLPLVLSLPWRTTGEARLLGLSSEYQSLARWFLTSGASDFAALVRSSFPHLLPDLLRDFSSGSSLFLTTLRLAPAASSPPATSSSLSLALLTLPSPLTCRLPAYLVASLCLPLTRCLPLFLHQLLLLLLPSRLLLASLPFCFFLFGVGFFSYGIRVGCGCPASFWGSPFHC